MKALLFNNAIYKIVTIYSVEPGSRWRRKELQEFTRLPNQPLDTALLKLQQAGVLKREKNLYALAEKTISNIIREEYERLGALPFNIYFALVDLVELFAKQKVTLILFGSYAKLTYTKHSDLDIAVLHGKRYKKERTEKLERRYNITIELHEFDKHAFLKNKKDPLVKEILRNGKQLIPTQQ